MMVRVKQIILDEMIIDLFVDSILNLSYAWRRFVGGGPNVGGRFELTS